jgi:hypothetical protein
MTRTLVMSVAVSLVASNGWTNSNAPHVSANLQSEHEVPNVSSPGSGSFKARIDDNGRAIDWELSFGGLQAAVTQAHIHLAQPVANGGVVVWLCGSTPTIPVGTQACPQSGSISGTILPNNIQTVAAQGIATGEFEELVAAIRKGLTYINVHTTTSPGGEIRGQVRRGGGHAHGRGRD